MYTIGQLAKRFGLSRSTLLYYDAIGLLPASTRSASGYRLYTEQAVQRMTHIQTFRDAGLPLETIRTLLASGTDAPTAVLERHPEWKAPAAAKKTRHPFFHLFPYQNI